MSWTDAPKKQSWGDILGKVLKLESGNHQEDGFEYRVQYLGEVEAQELSTDHQGANLPKPWSALGEDLNGPTVAVRETSPQKFVESNDKRVLGIEAHWLFEQLAQHSLATVRDLVAFKNSQNQKPLLESLEYLQSFKEVDMTRLLQEGHVEWPYRMTQGDGSLKEGRVDLWGLQDGVLWIVDFKTGSTKYKDKAFEQLQAYAEVLCQPSMGLQFQEIKLLALFPFQKKSFSKNWN